MVVSIFPKEWIKFCEDHGIRHEHTVPYNPQQNGIAERKNRTLLDASRCMLQVVGLDNKLWEEVVATASYLQNRSPHKVLGLNTPYAIWYSHKPHLGHLHMFGCIAYNHIPKEKRRKLACKEMYLHRLWRSIGCKRISLQPICHFR